jgi:hypothetical protein
VKTKEGGKMMSPTGKEGVKKSRKIGKKRDERGGGRIQKFPTKFSSETSLGTSLETSKPSVFSSHTEYYLQ